MVFKKKKVTKKAVSKSPKTQDAKIANLEKKIDKLYLKFCLLYTSDAADE